MMMGFTVQDLTLDKLPFNWFDGLVVAMLIAGLLLGRKHGMSKELLPLLKWVALVLVCGFGYETAAPLFANTAGWGELASAVCGYLILAFIVFLFFLFLKRLFVYRLGESNFFGAGEYYLGMMSGVVRYACMLVFALALLNAPFYTTAEIQAHKAYVQRWYGGGLYSGDYLPDLQMVQESVFKKSFLGPYVKDYLGLLLIDTTPPGVKARSKTAAMSQR